MKKLFLPFSLSKSLLLSTMLFFCFQQSAVLAYSDIMVRYINATKSHIIFNANLQGRDHHAVLVELKPQGEQDLKFYDDSYMGDLGMGGEDSWPIYKTADMDITGLTIDGKPGVYKYTFVGVPILTADGPNVGKTVWSVPCDGKVKDARYGPPYNIDLNIFVIHNIAVNGENLEMSIGRINSGSC